MRGNLHDSRFIVREAGVFRTFLFDFIYPHNSYLVSGIPQINVAADKNKINDPRGGGTLRISGWGCAAGTLEPLTYTRASSAKFFYPILE